MTRIILAGLPVRLRGFCLCGRPSVVSLTVLYIWLRNVLGRHSRAGGNPIYKNVKMDARLRHSGMTTLEMLMFLNLT